MYFINTRVLSRIHVYVIVIVISINIKAPIVTDCSLGPLLVHRRSLIAYDCNVGLVWLASCVPYFPANFRAFDRLPV